MPIYWEQNASGVQVKNFDTEEEDEDCEIQKSQTQSIKDEKQMKDLTINTILICDLQMINKYVSNACKTERFGIQRSKDDLSKVLIVLTKVFTQSLGVFEALILNDEMKCLHG